MVFMMNPIELAWGEDVLQDFCIQNFELVNKENRI